MYQRLTDIDVKSLREPRNIAACEQTSQLYVADNWECIWPVSADGTDVKRWWFRSHSLSVTSTRLLMTSDDNSQLMQLDAVGNELRRVQLPRYTTPLHAVESPTGTFVVSHKNKRLKPRYQVSEVDTGGKVLRQFNGSRLSSLGKPRRIAVDSHGNIFVADTYNRRILLLDAQLKLRRVIIDEDQLNRKEPRRLCYTERTGQLLVGWVHSIATFDVLRR